MCFLSFLWTRLLWVALPDLYRCQSHLHYLSPLIFCRVAGGTGACPSFPWTMLGVTFKRQTAPRVNKVWTDAIQQTPVASQTTYTCCKRTSNAAPMTSLPALSRRKPGAGNFKEKIHFICSIPCSHTSMPPQRTFVSARCFMQRLISSARDHN